MWYMIRNLRCTVTIDSVLANSKTQNAFLFTVNVIFLHDYPIAVEPGSTPRPQVQKKLGEILCLLICYFLPCMSWLLRSRVRKSRRDLRITLYFLGCLFLFSTLHVSDDYVPIIRRNNCIYGTLGICNSMWMNVWYAGRNNPAYQRDHPAYQTVIHTK